LEEVEAAFKKGVLTVKKSKLPEAQAKKWQDRRQGRSKCLAVGVGPSGAYLRVLTDRT